MRIFNSFCHSPFTMPVYGYRSQPYDLFSSNFKQKTKNFYHTQ